MKNISKTNNALASNQKTNMQVKNKTMTILALDLGTNAGWAILKNGSIRYGTVVFKRTICEGAGMTFLKFKRWLEVFNNIAGLDAVYFEEVRRHLGTDAAHSYGGFLSQLTAFCEEMEIPYQGVPVGTIKKHITGKGNASKVQVIESVKLLGFDPKDDNSADALALLNLVIAKH